LGDRIADSANPALGLRAIATDLNPVAVLINKALIEIPPKFAGRAPVHPKADRRTNWSGAEGLAEDVRRYGEWMRLATPTAKGNGNVGRDISAAHAYLQDFASLEVDCRSK